MHLCMLSERSCCFLCWWGSFFFFKCVFLCFYVSCCKPYEWQHVQVKRGTLRWWGGPGGPGSPRGPDPSKAKCDGLVMVLAPGGEAGLSSGPGLEKETLMEVGQKERLADLLSRVRRPPRLGCGRVTSSRWNTYLVFLSLHHYTNPKRTCKRSTTL